MKNIPESETSIHQIEPKPFNIILQEIALYFKADFCVKVQLYSFLKSYTLG